MNLSQEKKVMLLAAKRASKALLRHFGKTESAKEKPNQSLVSAADNDANDAIIGTIKKHFPKHSILSEETGFEDNGSDWKWVIDPLDGTHNFLHNIPIFGTSIALEYKGNVVLGVIHFPVLKMTALAEKGKGSFLNGKRLRVSQRNSLRHSFILSEFSYSKRQEKIKFLQKLVNMAVDIRNFGAAVYNLLLVASGKCEGYVILTTEEWDVAAGFLIIEEAGGKITGLNGQKWDFSNKQYVLSNGKVHKELLKYVNPAK